MNTVTARVDTRRSVVHWLTHILPFLVVGLAAAFALRSLSNTDTWWHLASGRWIVNHRTVPHLDTLSWTVPDHPWINVQWFYDVIIYWLYRLGGPSLLVVSSVMTYAGATALMYVNVRRHVDPVVAAVLCTWAVLIAQERFEVRPEMVTFLLLQVILWLYATGRVSNSKRLWALPAVMFLWANSHSLFILGVVIVISQMVGCLITDLSIFPQGWRRTVEPAVRKKILLTGAAALAATVVNPYFIKGATFPLMLMSRISGSKPVFRQVGEFTDPFGNFSVTYGVIAYRWFFFFAVAVVLMTLIVGTFKRSPGSPDAVTGLSRAERRRMTQDKQRRKGVSPALPQEQPQEPGNSIVHIDLADIAVLSGIAYLSTLAHRNIALLAMGGAPYIAACLTYFTQRLSQAAQSVLTFIKNLSAVVLIVLLLGGCWFIASNGFYWWDNDLMEFGLGQLDIRFPIRASAFMKAQGLPGPLYNDLGDGGYLTWSEPIPGGVYIDGRLEVYDADFFGNYMHILQTPSDWQAEMDRLGIQTVLQFHWWGVSHNLVQYLAHDSRWALVHYDETTVLFVRRAGNEEVISRAQAAFTPEREAMERALLGPVVRSWQKPMNRALALRYYSSVLDLIGRSNDAIPFRNLLLEINPDE